MVSSTVPFWCCGGHANLAAVVHRLECVQDQVGNDTDGLGGVEVQLRQRLKRPGDPGAGDLFEWFQRAMDEGVEIGGLRVQLEPFAEQAELGDLVVDPLDTVSERAQRVVAERRIIEVPRQILEHQGECRGGVLEVMHEESRHRLESLEFTRPQQPLGQAEGQ